jgi:hypothetical protein
MSYSHRIIGQTIYNPVSPNPSIGGMKQYLEPATNELAGKTLEVHLDGLPAMLVHFLDATNLQWARLGEPFRWEEYEAAKGDENLYIIKFLLAESSPLTHVTLVWDAVNTLITCVMAVLGEDKAHPRLVESKIYFGAQKLSRCPLTATRHSMTDELLGKRVIWRYNPNDEVMHIYHGTDHFRLGDSEKQLAENATEEAKEHYELFLKRKGIYPCYEEPAYYIKLREGFYLYSVTESNINRILPQQGGNQLLILLNAYRVRYIGRVFGLRGDGSVENDFIGGIGRFSAQPDTVESRPYPVYAKE